MNVSEFQRIVNRARLRQPQAPCDVAKLIVYCQMLAKDPAALADAIVYPDTKLCGGCRRNLKVIVGVTFVKKESTGDKLQPWCRQCMAISKLSKGDGWKSFQRELKARDIGELANWTESQYYELMGDWDCHYCGHKVYNWGSGYWVDKINPARGYSKDNTVPCCKPCNYQKSNSAPGFFVSQVKNLVNEYGKGKIPWDTFSPKWVHKDHSVPDLSQYVAPESKQGVLF